MKKITFPAIGLLCFTLLALFITPLYLNVGFCSGVWAFLRVAALAVSWASGALCIVNMHRLRFSEPVIGCALFMHAIFTIFILLEVFFMYYPYTFVSGKTLSSKLWVKWYWHTNSLGYRDEEVRLPEANSTCNIVVAGDSFTAGVGINQPEMRFTNVLQSKLPAGYRVFNLGVPGADTPDEYQNLLNFPARADLIVLVHYVNDAEYLTKIPDTTSAKPQVKNKKEEWFLVKQSFFINYIYYKSMELMQKWQFAAHFKNQNASLYEYLCSNESTRQLSETCFIQPACMEKHLQNLHRFADYANEQCVPLVVILFPKLTNDFIDFSNTYINKPITAQLQLWDIDVFNVYEIARVLPEYKRRVNRSDYHPSALLHTTTASRFNDFLQLNHILPLDCPVAGN
ncbi:SGNH/GDSL hydrolase family protein [Sphingobacteriales bacterium UPWRP_1]|nr:hypothetical protein B6N25_10410 [Sphingobacteriales bacterium TSM_CSS]PSJ78988.1 SGNH/GDSL hydrolase family protein [Sphingobacteriales bacterium UPWRP_1]